MTPGARLQAAIDILKNIDRRRNFVPADTVVHQYFRKRRYIGAKDRRAVSEQVYGVLRARSRLDWWIERFGYGLEIEGRLRLITMLAVQDGLAEDRLQSLFGGSKFDAPPLRAEEVAYIRRLNGRTLEHPDMPEHVRLECPDWAETPLRNLFGAEFIAEMEAINRSAPVDLRLNPLKTDRTKAIRLLADMGVDAEPTRWSPWGLRVAERRALSDSEPFQQGVLEVQDEGSQLIARLVGARPGMQIVDFCAGAGGKTLAMAAEMDGKGRVVACDVNALRLDRAGERARRADLHNIERRVLEGERDGWVKRHKRKFDRVLVDAPCSGTGTWRRNPDARWGRGGPDIRELMAIQDSVLASASRLVRPGGRLVYATCSLLQEENEQRIERFVTENPDFAVIDARQVWAELLGDDCPLDGPFMRLTPAKHGTDGFFCAVLQRQADSLSNTDADGTVEDEKSE